jgi:hypothetical protein
MGGAINQKPQSPSSLHLTTEVASGRLYIVDHQNMNMRTARAAKILVIFQR